MWINVCVYGFLKKNIMLKMYICGIINAKNWTYNIEIKITFVFLNFFKYNYNVTIKYGCGPRKNNFVLLTETKH